MTAGRAGDRVEYRVTWLEMTDRPGSEPGPVPEGEDVEVIGAAGFPEWYFFALYDAVGRDTPGTTCMRPTRRRSVPCSAMAAQACIP